MAGRKDFKPGPFIPPENPEQETETLRAELARLRAEFVQQQAVLTETQTRAEQAQTQAQEEAEIRQLAEDLLLETEAKVEAVEAREKLLGCRWKRS